MKLIAGLALSLFFTCCEVGQTTETERNAPARNEVVVGVRLFEFSRDNLDPWINGITPVGENFKKWLDKE